MRAIIYARYSSDLQTDRSLEDQIRDCRALADRQGWQVVDVLSDAAISGSTMQRPGIQAALAAALDRRCDVIVAEALDRISRDLGDTAKLYQLLTFHQVKLHTISEGQVTTLHVGFKGLINSQYLEDLALKIRRGQRGAAAKGLQAAGVSYGYEVVRELLPDGELARGKRRIREDQAEVIRRIFRAIAAGISTVAIVRELNAEGVPAPRGGMWNNTTILGHPQRMNGILRNELYVGRLIYNRVRMVKDPGTGKRISRINPKSEWQISDVPALRIIDQDLWDAAQAILSARPGVGPRQSPARHRRPVHLFSGLMRCGICGGNITSDGGPWLACSTRQNKAMCANNRRVDRRRLEQLTIDQLDRFLRHPHLVEAFVDEYRRESERLQGASAAERRALMKELSEIEGKISRLVRELEDGAGGSGAIARRVIELEARQAELLRRPAAAPPPPIAAHPQVAQAYVRCLDRLRSALEEVDPINRAEAVQGLRGMVAGLELTPAEGRGRVNVAVGIRGLPMSMVALDAANRGRSKVERPRNATTGNDGSGGLSPPGPLLTTLEFVA